MKQWNTIIGCVLAPVVCIVCFMQFIHYPANPRTKTYDVSKFPGTKTYDVSKFPRTKTYDVTKFLYPAFENDDGHVGDNQNTQPQTVNWTILVTVSYGFHDMFNNWWYYYRKLQLQIPVVMIAEDSDTLQKYKNQNGLSVLLGDNDVNNLTALPYDAKGYIKMVSKRATYILDQMVQGVNVLYTDIDTVWKKDPRPYFKGDCDMWAILDYVQFYCTGFMAIRNNQKTKEVIELWQKTLLNRNQLNQPIFNQILGTIKTKHCPLPTTDFPSGKEYFEQNSKRDVVLIHNNWISGHQKKVERFKALGLWHPGIDMGAE